MLVVVERRGLAGRPADDEAVGAVGGEMVHQGDERLLVDPAVGVERRDDRRQDAPQLHDLSVADARVRRPPHTRPSPCPPRTQTQAARPTPPPARCARRSSPCAGRRPRAGSPSSRRSPTTGEDVTLTGTLDHVHEGELLEAGGAWSRHAKHGWRFQVGAVRSLGPSSDAALLNLLSSVRHVGPSGAAWLLQTARAGRPGDRRPGSRAPRCAQVPGIGPSRIGPACRSWEQLRGRRALRLFLAEHGVDAAAAARIERAFGPEAIGLLREDPYAATEVDGVGFATADSLARALGTDMGAPERLDAGVVHALAEAERDGHCLLPRDELERRAAALLGRDVAGRIDELVGARAARRRRRPARRSGDGRPRAPARAVRAGARDRRAGPAPPRRRAARRAGPSSRPTTSGPSSTRCSPGAWRSSPAAPAPARPRRCAPSWTSSGAPAAACACARRPARRRAGCRRRRARRRRRSTGCSGWIPDEGFEHGPDDPITGADVLVVDEASMLSVHLADALLGAVGPRTHVLLVGDVDQLPPVGAGAVLGDLIDSGVVPTVRLTEVFRQAARSLIVRAAHAINDGEVPATEAGPDDVRDFFLARAR